MCRTPTPKGLSSAATQVLSALFYRGRPNALTLVLLCVEDIQRVLAAPVEHVCKDNHRVVTGTCTFTVVGYERQRRKGLLEHNY
jgi:hypothetical protein